MPDTPNGDKKKPTELTMERRLLLAFGLMGLVLLGTQYFMPKPPPPKKLATPVVQQQQPAPSQPAAAAPSAPAAPVPATAAAKEQLYTIDTPVYRIVLSNRGAAIRSWTLKQYKDSNGKPVDMASATGTDVAGWPLSYVFPKQQPSVNLNDALFSVDQTDPLTFVFTFSDGATSARKSFNVDAAKYRATLSSDVTSSGQPLPHKLAWRAGFGDRTAHNAVGTMQTVRYELPNNKLITQTASDAKNGPMTVAGSYMFAGLQDTFFAGVVLPEANTPIEFTTWADSFKVHKSDSDPTQVVGMAFGGTGAIKTTLFVGPKDLDVLRATNPKLEQIVDWGWFGIIAKPLFLWLHWTNDTLTNNWGWAIVLVTVIINLLMLPLKFSSLRSSSKMAAIQPQINAINEKYKNISLKDPRKQQQNQELMDLYQKSGINPLGGCIPLLLQMPFFIAFFKVLSVAIELRGAPWLWVSDLSQPEMSWFRLLPIAMLVTQVIMQRMTPTPGGDPSQKLMMQLMPVMLTAMFYGASSGLVLYWLTGNVVGIVQQYFFNKMGPQPAAAPAKASSQKKK